MLLLVVILMFAIHNSYTPAGIIAKLRKVLIKNYCVGEIEPAAGI